MRREGDVPSNPIIILEDIPTITDAPDVSMPPKSPQRLENRPRPDSYAGMMIRSSSRTKKSSSAKRRGASGPSFSQEMIDSISVSDEPNQSTSRGTSDSEEISLPPESALLEERSLQPNNNVALVDSDLPGESSVSTVKENPPHIPPAPETFQTDENVNTAVSPDDLVTASETATGLASSSIVLSSSLAADTPPKGLNQACSPIACTHPVSTVGPTDNPLSPNASGHTFEVS